jgi:hypothetical protein
VASWGDFPEGRSIGCEFLGMEHTGSGSNLFHSWVASSSSGKEAASLT